MFDDKNLPSSGQIPPNLPINEPDDMLAPTEGSEVPSALDAGILRPKSAEPADPANFPPAARPALSVPSAPASPSRPPVDNFSGLPPEFENQTAPEAAHGGGNRGALTAIIIFVVLLIVGGGGLWIYLSFVRNSDAQPAPVVTPAQPTPAPAPAPAPTPTPAPEAAPVATTSLENQILDGRPLDTDNDGIPDEEEKRSATDSLNWDTDGDGLSDGDEIYTWKTDALKADTDADGYKDGEEIRNGYNPRGPGKLFDPNAAATSTTGATNTTSADTSVSVTATSTTSVK